jgi:hypothetical protein
MQGHDEKANFLKSGFVPLLGQIAPGTPPLFGKMSVQHMIEHFVDAVKIASGKINIVELFTPVENLPRMLHFLMSDKPFSENLPNPLIPQTPAPVRQKSTDEAIAKLKKEIDFFFHVFETNKEQQTRNPFFGDLNFEQNVQLLYKHAVHHLRQFGVAVQS